MAEVQGGALIVRDQGGGPVLYGKWRYGRRQVERRIGRAWMVPIGQPGAKPNGKTVGQWRERKGRPADGYLTPDMAREALPAVVAEWREQTAQAEREVRRAAERGVTMREAADAWLVWGQTDDPEGERDAWKHSTAKNNRTYAGRVVRELGAYTCVDEVTHEQLRRFLVELRAERNGKVVGEASRKMRSTYALTVKGIFGHAHRAGWLEHDPSVGLPSYKAKRKRAGDPLRREEYLTPAEVRAVVEQCRSGDPDGPASRSLAGIVRRERVRKQDAAMVLAMAFTGMRPGEAIALRWQDVDLARSALHIVLSRTMGVTGTPKSDAGRTVPLAPDVAQALASLGLRGHSIEPTDLVFVGQAGGHVAEDALRDRYYAAQDRAGISPRRELRKLRNTFGTVTASSGVPLRTIQQWMGHERIETTERYANFMPRHEDAAKVSAAFAVSSPGEAHRV